MLVVDRPGINISIDCQCLQMFISILGYFSKDFNLSDDSLIYAIVVLN